MVATVQLKRRIVKTCIFDVVICELRYWLEPGPIVLFKVDKELNVDLYNAVLPFCLAISLRIKSHGKPLFDAKKVAEQ